VPDTRLNIADKGRRSPTSEADLVAALRAGDERAYATAWTELGPMVRRLVTRFFGPGAEPMDLSQEVFLKLFRRIDELRSPDGLKGFVAGICLGVSRNEARRMRVRRWVQLTATGALPDYASPAPDLEAREAVRRLYAVLDRVSAQDRSLFVARFLEKMEVEEVALAHGLSFGTAKRRIARAATRINRFMTRDQVLSPYIDRPRSERAAWSRRPEPVGDGGRTGGRRDGSAAAHEDLGEVDSGEVDSGEVDSREANNGEANEDGHVDLQGQARVDGDVDDHETDNDNEPGNEGQL
jgi:RNA polymerase sigma-70 factor (ECF subfamily)